MYDLPEMLIEIISHSSKFIHMWNLTEETQSVNVNLRDFFFLCGGFCLKDFFIFSFEIVFYVGVYLYTIDAISFNYLQLWIKAIAA